MKINSKLEIRDTKFRNKEFSTKMIRESFTSGIPGDEENKEKFTIYTIVGKSLFDVSISGNFIWGVKKEELNTWFSNAISKLEDQGYVVSKKYITIK